MTRYFSLLLLALLSLAAPAWASVIYVSGDQTGTWSADTVIVTSEVRVPPGQSLTILPAWRCCSPFIASLLWTPRRLCKL